MRLKTFLFSLSDLFLLLWVPPRESANGNICFSNEEDEARQALTDRTVSRWQQHCLKR
jgi:hypothetical protein